MHVPAMRIFVICFMVAMLDGFDTLVVSFTAPAFGAEWNLSESEIGTIFGGGLLGAAIGGVTGGMLADRIGHKRILMAAVSLFAVLTMTCGLVTDPHTMLALRFVAGLGLGAAIPAIAAITANAATNDRRSAIVTRMFLGFPLGAVIGGGIVALTIAPLGWRFAFWMGGGLGIAMLPVIHFGIEQSATIAGNIKGGKSNAGAGGVVGEGRLPASLCLFGSAFLILLVGYFLVSWSPSILVRAGASHELAIVGAVLLNVGGILGALALTRILDRKGPLLVAGSTLLCGSVLTVALGFQLGSPLIAIPLLMLGGATVIGAQLTLPSLAAHIFPAEARGRGVGITMGIGRLGSIIGPVVGGMMLQAGMHDTGLFLTVAVPVLLSGLLLLVAYRTELKIKS